MLKSAGHVLGAHSCVTLCLSRETGAWHGAMLCSHFLSSQRWRLCRCLQSITISLQSCLPFFKVPLTLYHTAQRIRPQCQRSEMTYLSKKGWNFQDHFLVLVYKTSAEDWSIGLCRWKPDQSAGCGEWLHFCCDSKLLQSFKHRAEIVETIFSVDSGVYLEQCS